MQDLFSLLFKNPCSVLGQDCWTHEELMLRESEHDAHVFRQAVFLDDALTVAEKHPLKFDDVTQRMQIERIKRM